MEIQEVKDKMKNKIAALATVNQKNMPHAIAVEVNDIVDNKLIITDNYMKTTLNNIKDNPYISIVFWDKKIG
jgi:predicted pyridoxine 5'-phosphate oxidase superfamily flavin-nucleotide-binding protein